MELRRLIVVSIVLVFVALESTAYGHVRWFLDYDEKIVDPPFVADTISILVVLGAVLFTAIACVINRVCISDFFERLPHFTRGIEWRIVAGLTGIMLIANALTGVFLAPNLTLSSDNLISIGQIGQVVIGALLLFQISFSLAGLLILAVAVGALYYIPLSLLVDYLFEFAPVALAMIFIGPTLSRVDRRLFKLLEIDFTRFAHFPLPFIRIGVGMALVVLAVHNKLMHPGLSLALLEIYPWNFMPYLGFASFSNLHFTFSAGVAELTLGILLLLGIATRFVTAVLSVFFVLSLILIGWVELIGHAPLIGIAVLLIIRGSGSFALFFKGSGTDGTGEEVAV
ncbi:MAG: hypothetical protein QGG64_04540 [Candidatus Latescibacteria bacterium]|jgi:uncharacterized membrane protein YphA (DoxX/SURF4 family)|nr:hypothetical protein [Candidatus Latescibacterota bacterium]